MLKMLERARALQDQIIVWRWEVHMHPELDFQEYRTSRFVADTLRDLGIRVETGVGKTGVVGYLVRTTTRRSTWTSRPSQSAQPC